MSLFDDDANVKMSIEQCVKSVSEFEEHVGLVDLTELRELRARLINDQTILIKCNHQQRSVQCRGCRVILWGPTKPPSVPADIAISY